VIPVLERLQARQSERTRMGKEVNCLPDVEFDCASSDQRAINSISTSNLCKLLVGSTSLFGTGSGRRSVDVIVDLPMNLEP